MIFGAGRAVGTKLPHLLVCVLLLGIADSMIGPYLVLFGADRARLSPLQVGVFLSVIPVSGLFVTPWLGRRYDRAGTYPPGPGVRWRVGTRNTGAAVGVLVGLGHRPDPRGGGAGLAGIRRPAG